MNSLLERHREEAAYLFFGILTTLVSIFSYWFFAHPMGISPVVSNVLSWFISVLFAYLTNRKWVFDSKSNTLSGVIRECISFYAARLFTGALDTLAIYLFVEILAFPDMLIKVLSNIVVIVLNYLLSKLFVFRS